MKRQFRALLCALLMILTLSSPWAGGEAKAATVYFTAMNDSLLELSDETMPFWYGSYLYIQASDLTSVGMGISYVHNTAKQTVVLYSNRANIIFDLTTGTASDGEGHTYSQGCVRRGGRNFVPASVVAKALGLRYSNIRVDNGYLIRLCSESAVLTDEVFADAAATLMQTRYREYLRSQTPATPSTPSAPSQSPAPSTPSTPAVPVNPPVTTDPDTGVTDPEDEEQPKRRMYLAATLTDADAARALVSAAEAYGSEMLFFVTTELLRDEAAHDAVRALVCSGCSVGLAAFEADAAAELREGNELLFALTNRKTRLVYLGGDAVGARETLEGYCVYSPTLTRTDFADAAAATRLLDTVADRSGVGRVYLGGDVKESALRSLLSGIRSREYSVLRFTEVMA